MLLRSARNFLHPGRELDEHGYDVTLATAALYAEPRPEISRWFNWIRTEIVRGGQSAIPCFHHPRFTPEFVSKTLGVPVYVITPRTIGDIAKETLRIHSEHAR
jgi:hypothetical protein